MAQHVNLVPIAPGSGGGSAAVSIVTGAASGIGAACVRRLAARGDVVVGVDLAPDVDVRVRDLGGALGVAADVSSSAACDAAVATAVDGFGRVDHLVAAAGIELTAPAHEMDDDTWSRVQRVNVDGSFFMARALGRHLIATGRPGSVVLIGSINSAMAMPGQVAYVSSKGAVLQLGRGLAVDWGRHGIRVNVVGPGVIDTPLNARSFADPQRIAYYAGRAPLGRHGEPAEVASVVAFLTSEDASYMTGAFVAVDGGWLAGELPPSRTEG
jgi:NAD(P)-dependent dehydrogenase (short-subunit alcohol dehydrogenase family)